MHESTPSEGSASRSTPGLGAPRWWLVLAALAPPLLSAPSANEIRSGRAPTETVWQRYVGQSHLLLSALNRRNVDELPAAPAGVTDLAFAEFFGPIGDRGLEYSAKLRALDGQCVRLVGYMIRETGRAPGLFRLTASPLMIDSKGLCRADNAPPSAVHVFVSAGASRVVPFRPGRLLLIGRLEIGPRAESDGRNSVVRLFLDDASAVFASDPMASDP